MSQERSKCPGCGELLEQHWRMCPVCGRTTGPSTSGARPEGGIYVSPEVLKGGGGRFGSVEEFADALRMQTESHEASQPRTDWDMIPPEDLPPLPEPREVPPLPSPPSDPTTALFDAIRSRSHSEVERLLQSGADPNAIGRDGWTPLHVAAEIEDSTMINKLVRYGAVLTLSNGVTPWHIAALEKKNPRLGKMLAQIRDRTGGVRYLHRGKRRRR